MHEHLISRHVDLNLHNPIITEDVATFYLYNLSGRIVGYQQYRPRADKTKHNCPKEGRYFTYKSSDAIAVFGLESLHLRSDVLFVTEGIFDAMRLTEVGLPAIAMLSNNPSKQVKQWIKSLGRYIVAVVDNDQAGSSLASVGNEVIIPDVKDLGEASKEFVNNIKVRFSNVR